MLQNVYTNIFIIQKHCDLKKSKSNMIKEETTKCDFL